MSEPFLRSVQVRNYKSIGDDCHVDLGRLTVIVGRNGSGKSNFLDALRFITDGLQTSLDHAIQSRGGIDEVRRRSTGHPRNFSVAVTFELPDWSLASYAFEIGSRKKGGFFVKQESLTIQKARGEEAARFVVTDGTVVESSVENMPPAAADRFYLVTASGLPQFRSSYDQLRSMGFYNLNPEQMKEFQVPDAGELLRRDGSNIASVIARLNEDQPAIKERITAYLRAIIPDIADFERRAFAHRETLQFRQEVRGADYPWRFNAASMSDGTLRSLGILVAVMQLANRADPIRLVGIEEPETALHPAATGALMDCLREAAETTQILITTHSPDLLDQVDLDLDTLLIAQANQGITEIGPADQASRDTIRKHLYTPGDLLRMDQLQPDREAIERQGQLAFEDVP